MSGVDLLVCGVCCGNGGVLHVWLDELSGFSETVTSGGIILRCGTRLDVLSLVWVIFLSCAWLYEVVMVLHGIVMSLFSNGFWILQMVFPYIKSCNCGMVITWLVFN